jgi:hypothetical protein
MTDRVARYGAAGEAGAVSRTTNAVDADPAARLSHALILDSEG